MQSFKEWVRFRELATTTASIATVPMRLGMGIVRRPSLMLGGEFIPQKKKRKKSLK